MNKRNSIAIRAKIFHFINQHEYEYYSDGLLVVINGVVEELGSFSDLRNRWQGVLPFLEKKDQLLMPGFVDGHIHAVQNGVMASYGAQLIDWLNKFTFPYEKQFAQKDFCKKDIGLFFQEMLKNGTTTAAIYSSVHQNSIEAIMEEAINKNMRIIAGKTNMDRNAPEELLENSDNLMVQSENLIEKYHKSHRISYALTPRFAITSSKMQLEQLAKLKSKYPYIHVQTHISENHEEIAQVSQLFPERDNYVDVYDHYKLLGKSTLLGHAIHFSEKEWARTKESGASIVHCPSSNLFLGSGLFNMQKCISEQIPLALGSDVGGGPSFSMLKTAAAAYQIAALRGDSKPTAFNLFYLLTLGGAQALGLENKIGNFAKGKEADFVLIDTKKPSALKQRISDDLPLEELLFALLFLGDEQSISATYLMGISME